MDFLPAPLRARAATPRPRGRAIQSLLACAALGSTSLVAACGGTFIDTPIEVRSLDLVALDVFEHAFQIVEGIDYLPFEYRIDGCYARALYMSMELAASGVPSNALFAFAAPEHPLSVGEIEWDYHVAPMLEVQRADLSISQMVIDPSLSRRPITRDGWLRLMGRGPGQTARPEESPRVLIVPGSRYSPWGAEAERAFRDRDVPSFAELPPFQVSDIQNACEVMHGYLGLEPNADAELIAGKQAKLVERTVELIGMLRDPGKLDEDSAFSAEACGASDLGAEGPLDD